MELSQKALNLLPGFNCGACGLKDCYQFSLKLANSEKRVSDCPVFMQDRFLKKKQLLEKLLLETQSTQSDNLIGLIDHAVADFSLHPYEGEPSCRETLVSFSPVPLKKDMIIRYRPLGCPIIHFGQIVEINNGLMDVWVVGPRKLLLKDENYTEVGICMVLSFQGIIEGEQPKVGQTVKFLPAHCMMGKVHSGVIVHLEDNRTRIDCIDLKIWEHANNKTLNSQEVSYLAK